MNPEVEAKVRKFIYLLDNKQPPTRKVKSVRMSKYLIQITLWDDTIFKGDIDQICNYIDDESYIDIEPSILLKPNNYGIQFEYVPGDPHW